MTYIVYTDTNPGLITKVFHKVFQCQGCIPLKWRENYKQSPMISFENYPQPWADLLKYGSGKSNKELIQLETKY